MAKRWIFTGLTVAMALGLIGRASCRERVLDHV